MYKTDWVLKAALLAIALFLGIIAVRPYFTPDLKVSADAGRFEHVHIVSPSFAYKGSTGVLLMDKRNGNVWFIAKSDDFNISFKDPVFVVHVPLEKLDQTPPQ
jgi:hypothetical protein